MVIISESKLPIKKSNVDNGEISPQVETSISTRKVAILVSGWYSGYVCTVIWLDVYKRQELQDKTKTIIHTAKVDANNVDELVALMPVSYTHLID